MTTLTTLIANTRTDVLDDTIEPYKTQDDQLLRFTNEAVARASLCAAVAQATFTISVVADTATYALDASIRQILLAKMALQNDPLIQTTDDELQVNVGRSWRITEGTPSHYVRQQQSIILYPSPIVNDTLSVTATVSKIDQVAGATIDIDPAFLMGLEYWIAYRVFNNKYSEVYDPQFAADQLKSFNDFFGIPKSAKWHLVANQMPLYATVRSGRLC